MGTAYYDPRSVSLRLDRTICMYKGEPLYVELGAHHDPSLSTRIGPDYWHILWGTRLKGGTKWIKDIDYRSPDFDYRALPLGYINHCGGAYYLARSPARQQKQGLCRSSTIFVGEQPQVGTWWASKDLHDCIMGIYPSLDKALKDLEEYKAMKVAVSRNVAIAWNGGGVYTLHHKGRQVGFKEKFTWRMYETRERKALVSCINEEMPEIVCV